MKATSFTNHQLHANPEQKIQRPKQNLHDHICSIAIRRDPSRNDAGKYRGLSPLYPLVLPTPTLYARAYAKLLVLLALFIVPKPARRMFVNLRNQMPIAR